MPDASPESLPRADAAAPASGPDALPDLDLTGVSGARVALCTSPGYAVWFFDRVADAARSDARAEAPTGARAPARQPVLALAQAFEARLADLRELAVKVYGITNLPQDSLDTATSSLGLHFDLLRAAELDAPHPELPDVMISQDGVVVGTLRRTRSPQDLVDDTVAWLREYAYESLAMWNVPL